MPGYALKQDMQLPWPTAIWVLLAHMYALLVPLLLMWVVTRHWGAVVAQSDYPLLLYVAAGLMMAGSAFEVAQNSIDKWYLTPDCASANGAGFCDLLFYSLIVASQAAVAIACMGSSGWVTTLALTAVVACPLLYVWRQTHFAALGLAGLLAAATAWWRFDDPVILLQLLLTPLTLIFFGGLLKTGNQVLHGLTTIAASSGVVFLSWGIQGAAKGAPQTWVLVALLAGLISILALAIRPWLLRLPATPRG